MCLTGNMQDDDFQLLIIILSLHGVNILKLANQLHYTAHVEVTLVKNLLVDYVG